MKLDDSEKQKTVNSLYKDHVMYQPTDRRFFAVSLIFAIFFGMIAGVVGDLLAKTYLYEYFFGVDGFLYAPESLGDVARISVNRQDTFSGKEPSTDELFVSVKEARGTVVTIALEKKPVSEILPVAYLESDRVGYGVILTRDGWVLTSKHIFNTATTSYVVITDDGKVYAVATTLVDPFTGLMFFKIPENRLPVVPFASEGSLSVGQELFSVTTNGSLSNFMLSATRFSPQTQPTDIISFSDRASESLLLTPSFPDRFEGMPLFNAQGELTAIVHAFFEQEQKDVTGAVSIDQFRDVIADVLKKGEIVRASLGVDYLDISRLVFDDASIKLLKLPEENNRGAFIYRNDVLKVTGVRSGSAAAQAKLLKNDIILKVNDESIDANHSLSGVIATYKPDDRVNVTVLRAGVERIIEVTLGDAVLVAAAEAAEAEKESAKDAGKSLKKKQKK